MTAIALVSRADAETSDNGMRHLEALGERLRAEGWYARVVASARPGGAAGVVRVVNPVAPPLNDDVTVGPDEAGLWWFRWSFGTRIAHAGNVELAAARIVQVLGCCSR